MELVEIIDEDTEKIKKQETKGDAAFDHHAFRILRRPTKGEDEKEEYFRQLIGKLVEDHLGNYSCSFCSQTKAEDYYKDPNVESTEEESLNDEAQIASLTEIFNRLTILLLLLFKLLLLFFITIYSYNK